MRTVYVNGEYLPEDEAKISVFDRGFLFADAVYEVTTIIDGKLIDFPAHMERLSRSLRELSMERPLSDEQLLEIHRQLVRENNLTNGLIYLQVSRGAADRDFAFPDPPVPPSVVLFTQAKDPLENQLAKKGARIITVEDCRWARRDIKTVQLLYPSMAKMKAKEAGVDDAWLCEDGMVNEGTSNNAWIVTQDGTIVTRHLSHSILHGITRAAVMKCAELLQMKVEERAFSVDEARSAREAFITSASAFVTPVVEVDGVELSDGTPGLVSSKLREIYLEESRKHAL